MVIKKSDLKKQFTNAKNQGWLPLFMKASQTYNFSIDLLLAIASRESNIKQIIGDSGHGYSMFQIDSRSFPEWIKSGKWKNAEQSILKGAEVLDSKRKQITENVGKKITVKASNGKKYTFTMPSLSGSLLVRTFIAAYNSGLWGAYHVSKGRDPDFGTTGKDYSKDVIARSVVFKEFLEQEDLTTPMLIENGFAEEPAPPIEEVVVEGSETPPEPVQDSPIVKPTPVTENATGSPVVPSEGFLQASLGGAKRLWATLTGLGITVSTAVFDWTRDNKWLIIVIAIIILTYVIIQAILDLKRMRYAADPKMNSVK